MDKSELAQKFAEILLNVELSAYLNGDGGKPEAEDIAYFSWKLADAMQDEAKKREDTSRPDAIKDE